MRPVLVIGNKNYSSWSLRPWLALRKAGVRFDEVNIPLQHPDTATRIAEYSPSGRVPVLIDGDRRIWDSLAILEYLAEDYPWLWPEARSARAFARSACAEMHSSFTAMRTHLSMNCRAQDRTFPPTPAILADIERICALWMECRTRFGQGGDWLFGQFTNADAMFAPVVFRFDTYGVALPPACEAYCEHVLSDPDVRAWGAAAIAEPDVIALYEMGLPETTTP